MTLADALDRTLLLMRDEVGPDLPDEVLITALTSTTVVLVADRANLSSHSAQTAFVTAAILLARSAHRVFLAAPDVDAVGTQPPLPRGALIRGLVQVGRDMLPGVEFGVGAPDAPADLAIAFGDTSLAGVAARRRIRVNAEPWAGLIEREDAPRPWGASSWPLGGCAAAGLAAGEAFKVAMSRLLPHALNPAMTAAVFAQTDEVLYRLAPPGTPYAPELGEVDFISGGAINSSALYVIARLPSVCLHGRIVEPDSYGASNLNRYPLMLASQAEEEKAISLADTLGGGMALTPVVARYEFGSPVEPLAPTVVVGVDDIPTRWAVQRTNPDWLVVGATTHWSAMASFHRAGLACAQCLHPEDDPGDALIPTQACVSFWAGLHVVAYLVRHAAGAAIPASEQHIYLTPFRPESPYAGEIPARADCPTCANGRAD
jgi:hypothetical protein